MKKILFFLVLCFIVNALRATVFTVSNDPTHPAQFISITAASNAASDGDTIQFFSTVSPCLINKRLVIAGMGYSGLNGGPTLQFWFGSSGSKVISGSYSTIRFHAAGAYSFENIHTYAFAQGNSTNPINLSVRNSVIADLEDLGNYPNAYYEFENCIISGYSSFTGSHYNVNHCVFTSQVDLGATSDSLHIIQNSIFLQGIGNLNYCTNPSNGPHIVLDRNMFVGMDYSNYIGNCNYYLISPNNIMNAQNPFVNNNLTSGYNLTSLNLLELDLNLIESSEGNNAALDGTDLGVHGGNYPWSMQWHYGYYAKGIPVVNSLNVDNTVVGINDEIHFQSEGAIPSNN